MDSQPKSGRRGRPRRHRANDDSEIKVEIFGASRYDYQEELSSRINGSKKTGLVYDERLLLHRHDWDANYPENPLRISSPWQRINELGLVERCVRIKPVPIPESSPLLEELHDSNYLKRVRECSEMGDRPDFEDMMKTFDGIYVNKHTWEAALLSAGGVLELTRSVVEGDVRNGMAIVRPPGHHAMHSEACGYCFLNNVAIAAEWAVKQSDVKRVLIVDWDVHHGQGTQYQFYDRKDVLYFSIHRYENAEFWPNLRESDFDFIGEGSGCGYNINVPLNKTGMTNSDYLAIFHNLLMPVAYEFNPDLVIVSCGYDAAIGCPEGKMEVTPACYAHLIHYLMCLARGKVVVALEGGYCIESLTEGVALTLKTLLGDSPPRLVERLVEPSKAITEMIRSCITSLYMYWKALRIPPVSKTVVRPDISNLKTESWPDVKSVAFPEVYTVPDPAVRSRDVQRIENLISETNIAAPSEGRTCFVFDKDMMLHASPARRHPHPEVPERILYIYNALEEQKLLQEMHQLPSRTATLEEMALVHDPEYLLQLQRIDMKSLRTLVIMTQTASNSCYFSQHTFSCTALACGSLLNVVDAVCEGRFRNGFAAIRPPGHHAFCAKSEGFCYVNHVAVAARYAQKKWNAKRILIVDWDVHHGNGTQSIFEDDPSVLFISIHRHDEKRFYPYCGEGAPEIVGRESGEGYTVNIAFPHHRTKDMAYVAAFLHVVMPVAYEFDPDLVLVSSGFDAAEGDSIGGFSVTPSGFAHLTHLLGQLAGGRLILSLEGGYKDRCLVNCSAHCVSSLLGHPLPRLLDSTRPKARSFVASRDLESIRRTVVTHHRHWKCLKFSKPIAKWVSLETRSGDQSEASTANSIIDDMHALRIGPSGYQQADIRDRLENIECPHVNLRMPVPTNGLNTMAPCKECSGTQENWVCLCCYEVHCSRYVKSHMLNHALTSGHPLVLSFTDLSVWCYDCNHYIVGCKVDKEEMEAKGAAGGDLSVQGVEAFAVVPLTWCPHLSTVTDLPPEGLSVRTPCLECDHVGENWVCLVCYQVLCSRYVAGHMVSHGQTSAHNIVLSYADLSVWCYACDSYVHHESLAPAKQAAHRDKFGPQEAASQRLGAIGEEGNF